MQVGGLLGGAIVTEVVFSLPGTGSLALNGILNRDFPVVQGVVLVVACGYVLINIVVDIVYVLLDPRIGLRTPTVMREVGARSTPSAAANSSADRALGR